MIVDLVEHSERQQEKIQEGVRLGWRVEELNQMLFGYKSERYTNYSSDVHAATQPTLGAVMESDDINAVIAASRSRAAREQELKEQQSERPATNRHNKRHVGRSGKRTRQYQVEEVISVVDYEGDKTGLELMGTKKVVTFDYVPGKVIRKIDEFKQYISKDKKIFKAAVPVRVIERGTVSNRLVAYMQVEKFSYYAPYYRQLQKLQRLGIVFAASTVSNWEEVCYKKLKRLLKLMKQLLHEQDYAQVDEVPVHYVNDVGKGHCSQGYFWVAHAPGKMVLFEFNKGRGSDAARNLMGNFTGRLQCDGWGAYVTAFGKDDGVTLMSCLVHIRRYFYKCRKMNREVAEYFLNETRVLYDLEKYAAKKGYTDQERAAMRQTYGLPILYALKQWLEQQSAAFPPDMPITKAINYALNHWEMIYIYAEDGKLLPDTNGVERMIRPVTLFRKNSMFAGNEHGAERAALFFSIIETCKMHGIDPFEYLCDIYDRLHECTAQELPDLVPHRWKELRKAASLSQSTVDKEGKLQL